MRVHVTRLRVEGDATALAAAFENAGCVVSHESEELDVIVPLDDADSPADHDDAQDTAVAELEFFLRTWRGRGLLDQVEILDERVVEFGDDLWDRLRRRAG